MGRILSIDYGKKRVGLAVSDPLKIIANRLTTIPAHSIWDFLKEYLAREKVETIVVGYPVQMNNQASEAVKYVDPFLNTLRKRYPEIHIVLADERFTSKMAFQTMIDGGLGREKRRDKAMVDAISATIILQNYMEQKRNLP